MEEDSFLDYLRLEKNYSEATIASYRNDLNQFKEYVCGLDDGLNLVNADADVVRDWISQLMNEGYRASSVNRKLSTLRSFYRYLLKNGIVEVDPMRRVSGLAKKKVIPVFLRERQMEELLEETDFGSGYSACLDKTIVETLYATGMRSAEVRGLDDKDVDLQAGLFKVTGKRNKQRLVPFAESLRQVLEEYLRIRNEEVPNRESAFFVNKKGERLTRGVLYNLVRKNLSKVTVQQKRSPHVLRHTFATQMLNHGAELTAIKELLGHASLTTTEVYTHTTFEELKKVYKQAHPRA